MIERKCAFCSEMIQIDEANSNKAIRYKLHFYHYDCFREHCQLKSQSKRASQTWRELMCQIDQLAEETTKQQKEIVYRDALYKWIGLHYNLSCISDSLYRTFASIYDGTYKGLMYPIAAEELLEEWQFYFKELCAIRSRKGIVGELAIRYDIAVLLSRNAEYRQHKQKEKIAQEVKRQQQEEQMAINIQAIKTTKQSRNKIADLYKEINGGEDNE